MVSLRSSIQHVLIRMKVCLHNLPISSFLRDFGSFRIKRLFLGLVRQVSILDVFNGNSQISSTSPKRSILNPSGIQSSINSNNLLPPQSLIDTQISLRIEEHYSKTKIISKQGDRMPLCGPLQAWLCQI